MSAFWLMFGSDNYIPPKAETLLFANVPLFPPLLVSGQLSSIYSVSGKGQGVGFALKQFFARLPAIFLFSVGLYWASRKKNSGRSPAPLSFPLVFGSVFWGRKTRRKLMSFSPLMPNYIISSRTAKKRFIPCAFFLASCCRNP